MIDNDSKYLLVINIFLSATFKVLVYDLCYLVVCHLDMQSIT